MPEFAEADVVVVGGGIWGLSTAYHLAALGAGRGTWLLERNAQVILETTRQSAGQIGQLRGDPLLVRAIGYTLDLLSGLGETTGHNAGLVRSGSLHLALCQQRAALFGEVASLVRQMGVAVEWADPPTMRRLAPTFRMDEVVGALWVPHDGYVHAPTAASAFAAAAIDLGVRMVTGVCVEGVVVEGGRVVGVRTSQGLVSTSKVIIAAGPWTGPLLASVGFTPPCFPIRLQQARTVSVGLAADHPVVRVPDASCYVRPERGGYLHGFFDPDPLAIELNDHELSFRTGNILPDPQLVAESHRRLSVVLPSLADLAIDEYRQGMITCSPDGRFVIGPVPQVEGLWMAAGCGGTGIAACGAIGRWLAHFAVHGHPGDDIMAYDPNRFGDKPQDRAWLREAARATSAAYYRLPQHASS
jgi:4-methylaminobutanoate oxidase (formaldehyde-forming)